LYGNKDYVYWDVDHVGWEKFTNVFEELDLIGSRWVPTPNILLLVCRSLSQLRLLFYPEDGSSMFLQKTAKFLIDYMVSCPTQQ
jgi:hypothetical protein